MTLLNESDLEQFRREGSRLVDELEATFKLNKRSPDLLKAQSAATQKALLSMHAISKIMGFGRVVDQYAALEQGIKALLQSASPGDSDFDSVLTLLTQLRGFFQTDPPQKNPFQAINEISTPIGDKTPIKAMVIDDEPEIVKLITSFLQDGGIEVFGMTDPKEGLAKVGSIQPDIVLSDMSMPKMKGSQLAIEIRKIDIRLPIFFVSGHLNREVLLESVTIGVAGVFEKPFNPEKLVERSLEHGRRYQLQRMIRRSTQLIMLLYTEIEKHVGPGVDPETQSQLRSEIQSVIEGRRELLASYSANPALLPTL